MACTRPRLSLTGSRALAGRELRPRRCRFGSALRSVQWPTRCCDRVVSRRVLRGWLWNPRRGGKRDETTGAGCPDHRAGSSSRRRARMPGGRTAGAIYMTSVPRAGGAKGKLLEPGVHWLRCNERERLLLGARWPQLGGRTKKTVAFVSKIQPQHARWKWARAE